MYIKLVGYRVFQQVLEKIQNLREIRIWKSYVKNIRQIEVRSALLLRIFFAFLTLRIFWSHLCTKLVLDTRYDQN